jgi:FlgN protein
MNAPELISRENASYCLELLEKRIALFTQLADALVEARRAAVSFDLDSLEEGVAKQEQLCLEIRSMEAQLGWAWHQCLDQPGATQDNFGGEVSVRNVRETLKRLQEVQGTVKRLNKSHRMLLRRSCRTVAALLNAFQSFAATCSEPSSLSKPVGESV